MTASAVERDLPRASQWARLDGLFPFELKEELGSGVGAWSVGSTSCSFSFGNARLTVPIVGNEGVASIEMEKPNGITRSYEIPNAVIGQCGKLILIVPPAEVRVTDGTRQTLLSWFEVSDGRMSRREEALETVRELGVESPVIEAVLQASQEAEELASRAFQGLFRG